MNRCKCTGVGLCLEAGGGGEHQFFSLKNISTHFSIFIVEMDTFYYVKYINPSTMPLDSHARKIKLTHVLPWQQLNAF